MLCGRCRVPGSASPAPETVALLGALLAGDWGVAEASEMRNRREGNGLVAAYLSWHLERGLRSLPHVDRSPLAGGAR
jgi:DNA repair protein RecO (recombination protein O)